jgi:DNA-binding LacI/PurR family transcriptional regulator
VLIFHPRAKRKSIFGAKLLDCLVAALDRERIDWRMVWTNPADSKRALLVADRYPVIWERPEVVEKLISLQRCALLLNQRPPAGVGSTLIDSISVDDFSGGAGAAQFLLARCPRSTPQFAILSGPVNDPRSSARVAGFLSIAQARVVSAPTWFYDDAKTVAVNVLRAGPDGIFCCNDRLAEAAIRSCAILGMTRPAVVGFDDAPVATWLKLTTVAIPWEGLVAAASSVIRRRMTGAASSAIAQLISTRIIVRD